jgi:protoporphyrinogen oxidase
MSSSRPAVVVGAGLAGLSAATRYPGALVLEAASRAGGLCASSRTQGFAFDRAGHLWHFADPSTRALVQSWLQEPLRDRRRRAGVWFRGRMLPYPVQLALGRLPRDVAEAARAGLLEARRSARQVHARETFAAACERRYGEALTALFLAPYQEKVLGRPLDGVLAEPLTRFLPDVGIDDMLGSLRGEVSFAGYNAVFSCPRGGCGRVCDALAARTPGLRLEAEVTALDCTARTVTVAAEEVVWERLVATIPLRRLALLTADLPPELRRAATFLEASAVVVVNLGVSGPAPTDLHWVYYPEPEYPFYRAGCYTDFAPEYAPAGCHSLYVELPAAWWDARPETARLPAVLGALEGCGMVTDARAVVAAEVLRLDPAYVVPTAAGAAARRRLMRWFETHGVVLHGRYARWDYLAMDDVAGASRRLP